ncbi:MULTISPECIES: transcriptional coactivator p15/PC4 family protein [Nitrincola]|nr:MULTISPECIES: transcriptional coactivator p15/PC4 family protein [Nitrincola]
MANSELDEIILSETGPEKKLLRMSLSEFEGTRLLNVRYYYKDTKTGEIKPTRKGIALGRNRYVDIFELFEKHHSEILDYFDNQSTGFKGLNGWKSRVEKVARTQKSNAMVITSIEPLGGRDLYDIVFSGAEISVKLNNKNKFVSTLSEQSNPNDLLGRVAAAFELACQLVADEQSNAVVDALDHLKYEFSRQLSSIAKGNEG